MIDRRIKNILILLDIIILISMLSIMYYFRLNGNLFEEKNNLNLIAILLIYIGALYLGGGYHLEYALWRAKSLIQILLFGFLAWVLILSLVYINRMEVTGLFGRGILFSGISLATIFNLVIRYLLFSYLREKSIGESWLVIVKDNYKDIFQKDTIKNFRGEKYEYISVSDADPVLKNIDQVKDNFLNKKYKGLIVGVNESFVDSTIGLLVSLKLQGVPVFSLSAFYETRWDKIPLKFISHFWVIQAHGTRILSSRFTLRVKRVIDVIGAIVLFVILLPVLLIFAILVKLQDGGPIIYQQIRVGKGGREFVLNKFRSMRFDSEIDGAQFASKNDERVTFIGKIMRKTRIDELPQLWNVVKGEMSFIGPRPERPEFVKQFLNHIPQYDLRHLVVPGLTGWAQVNYPYGASSEDSYEKLQYDLYYLKNYSVFLDFVIIMRTLKVIIGRKGL